jgi:hypothetical protein
MNWEYLSFWQQQADFLSHVTLPIVWPPSAGWRDSRATCGRACLEVVARTTSSRRGQGAGRAGGHRKHALRNALLPIVTILGLSLPTLIGGSVIVESIFAIPGMGQLMVQAAFERDYPVIMGNLVIVATLTLLANLVADVAYASSIRASAWAAGRRCREELLAGASRATAGRRSAVVAVVPACSLAAGARARAVGSRTARRQEDPRPRPRARHWLGTDQLGRDVLSRMLYGARVSLAVGFVSVGIATSSASRWRASPATRWHRRTRPSCGSSISCWSSRASSLLLAVLAFLKPVDMDDQWSSSAVTGWMGVARLVRAEFLALKEREFRALVAVHRRERVPHSSGVTSCPTRWRPCWWP